MAVPIAEEDAVVKTISRADRATGRSTLQKVAQLEQRVVSLERERSGQLYSRRHEFRKVFCSLEDTEIKLNIARKTEKKELGHQISRIRGNVQSFQKMLADMKPGPTFMERLRQVLEETEASILAFKDKQRNVYESLLVEERQTNQEVMAFHRRMESWPTTSNTAEHTTTTTTTTTATTIGGVGGTTGSGRGGNDTALPSAVMAFERFLQQTGGVRGGWDEYDHNTFQHLKTKHPTESVFIEAAVHELPTHTESEIRAHSDWYSEYCTLLEAKKLSIQQWRDNKKLVRSQQLKGTGMREEESEFKKKESAAETKKREQERELKKEKLQTWKVRQELERQAKESEKLREEQEKTKRMKREAIRQAEVHEQVRRYQEVKEREREIAEQEEQRRLALEREQIMTTQDIEKFRERDMRAVAEKREKLMEKELAKTEQKKRLDRLKGQVEISVARDPQRLLKLTAGWQERQKAREKEEGCQRGASIGVSARELPKRAVPAWRQGL